MNEIFWAKLLILLLILFYEFFGLAIFNQIKTMNQIVSQPSAQIVESIAIANLIAGLSLFILALSFL